MAIVGQARSLLKEVMIRIGPAAPPAAQRCAVRPPRGPPMNIMIMIILILILIIMIILLLYLFATLMCVYIYIYIIYLQL